MGEFHHGDTRSFGLALVERAVGVDVGLVNDPDEVKTETRDPNDDHLIALARAHDVDVIVSGDKDLQLNRSCDTRQ